MTRLVVGTVLLLSACVASVPPRPPGRETILFMRHGEKPAAGLGQIACMGLNRALALPKMLSARFGRPAAIFAPDPGQTIQDRGVDYNYIRPLATIEPTAIALGLPVNTAFGVRDMAGLEAALTAPAYGDGTVFVAWEHRIAVTLARDLMTQNGGDAAAVPDWPAADFDSIYIVTITTGGGKTSAAFMHEAEHLDGQKATCP